MTHNIFGKRLLAGWLGLIGGMLLATAAQAGPPAEPWPYWEAHNPDSTVKIDHTPWAQFLDRYLVKGEDGTNRVDYGAISRSDRQILDDYIRELTAIPIRDYNRDEQFAYWVNFYNALTAQVVLDHYPVDSIRDINISPGFFSTLFSRGPWDKKLIEVEGKELSLNDIEHRILRPVWQDRRIHYAVNCAALDCPNLQPEPLKAENLETMLEAAAYEFINHPKGARVEQGRLRVNSIFHWYQEDFDGSEAGVIQELRRYAQGELAEQLENISRIHGHYYNWGLNDVGN